MSTEMVIEVSFLDFTHIRSAIGEAKHKAAQWDVAIVFNT